MQTDEKGCDVTLECESYTGEKVCFLIDPLGKPIINGYAANRYIQDHLKKECYEVNGDSSKILVRNVRRSVAEAFLLECLQNRAEITNRINFLEEELGNDAPENVRLKNEKELAALKKARLVVATILGQDDSPLAPTHHSESHLAHDQPTCT